MTNYLIVNTNERASRQFKQNNVDEIVNGNYQIVDWSNDKQQAKYIASGSPANFGVFPTCIYTNQTGGVSVTIPNPSSIAEAEVKRDAVLAAGGGEPASPPDSAGDFARAVMGNDIVVSEIIKAIGIGKFSTNTQAYLQAMRAKYVVN